MHIAETSPRSMALLRNLVLFEFFSQGPTINTQATRRTRLVVFAVVHNGGQQWFFDFTENRFVEVAGIFTIEVAQVILKRIGYRRL
jgi:hypothetical protein